MPIPNKRSEFRFIPLHQVADRPQNAFGEVIKDTAHARDGGICFIQGVSVNNTELAWLVPPTLARWVRLASEFFIFITHLVLGIYRSMGRETLSN